MAKRNSYKVKLPCECRFCKDHKCHICGEQALDGDMFSVHEELGLPPGYGLHIHLCEEHYLNIEEKQQ